MPNTLKKTIFFFVLSLITQISIAQVDSLFLEQDKLGLKDIRITQEEIAKNKVFTASRVLNSVEEIPLTIYVVTGDEIIKNGYFTLTDVLKNVPGIRVSQPGSAIEGETFTMNGLHGNTHAKIMVNNIPVKPLNVAGMPIGSQLPIRQAERIEITYGPSAPIHGTESGAGSINIITRTSERPVYTHADLAVGSQGYNSVNVLFGGKIGSNKRILKFNAYGSSTEARNTNLVWFTNVFDPKEYPINSFISNNEIAFQVPELPRSSRQIGVNLNYRAFTLSASRMSRREHSGLGSNPLSVSYLNPQTVYGEDITTANLLFEPNFKKFDWKTSIEVLSYVIDSESSFDYTEPHLKQISNFVAQQFAAGDIGLRDRLIDLQDSVYFEGRRFVKGSELDLKLEQTFSLFLFKNLELLIGANFILVQNNPYEEYLPERSEGKIIGTRFTSNTNYTNSFFTQAYFTFKKLNIILGANSYQFIDGVNTFSGIISKSKFLPRAAAQYKLRNNLSLRASYSTSYMVPSDYFANKSGSIILRMNDDPHFEIEPTLYENSLKPQETTYGDIGLRWKITDKIKYDLSVFHSRNNRLLSYDWQAQVSENNIPLISYGYQNDLNIESELTGLKSSLTIRDVIDRMDLDVNFHFAYFRGQQALVGGEKIERVLSQPDYISQLNFSFRLYKKMYVVVENVFVGNSASRKLQTVDDYYMNTNQEFRRDTYFTTDIAFTLPLNNNFKLFTKVNNVFGLDYAGIDATGTPDDLYYNMQRGRYVRFGASYTID